MEQLILGLSGLIAPYIIGAGGTFGITQWLKNRFGLAGFGAKLLSWVVTAVLGTVAALASGELVFSQLSDLPTYLEFLYGILFVVGVGEGSSKLYKSSK